VSPPPRVTVITPTYNRADLLAETIDSVLGQRYPDLEYLVIDDGSTDGTREVVAPYLQSHPRVIRYFHHGNRGEAATVNRGWELATGNYFAYVGSDDPMLPGWLEKGVAFMEEHPDVLVGYPDWRMIDEHSHLIKDVQVLEYDFAHMAGWFNCLPGPGAFIRRTVLVDLGALRDSAYRFMPDFETWLRLALRGPFQRIPETLATWRHHAEATTVAEQNLPRAGEYLRLADRFFARLDLPPAIARLHRRAKSRAWYLAALALGNNHPAHTLYYLARSLVACPVEPRDLPTDLRRNAARKFLGYGRLLLLRLIGAR